jgi:diacylglycerol O-acyltransferase
MPDPAAPSTLAGMTGLSALDTTFLELEQADPSAHMHIGGVLVFDGGPECRRPSLERVADRVRRRVAGVPRFAQRLSHPEAGGLRRPTWIDVEDFDPAAHIHRAALPVPGGDDELLEWAGDFFSHRLDRRRPLWEVAILENLLHDRWALVTKVHHCLADGIGSLDMLLLLADDIRPLPARRPPPGPGELRRLAGGALGAMSHPVRTVRQAEAVTEWVVRDEVVPAPPCSLNRPIGAQRRLGLTRTTLQDVDAIREALGGTVNDVVLTAVTGGLRALLSGRGEAAPAGGLRAMVPVNLPAQEDGALGNRVSSLFVALPVAEEDPARRHEEIRRRIAAEEHGRSPEGVRTLLALAEHLPPVLHALGSQSVLGRRLFNVTITNVPGGSETLWAFGAPLVEVIPIVPLAADHGVGVAVISYAGRLTVGVLADRASVPDVDVLVHGIERTLADLRALAPSIV